MVLRFKSAGSVMIVCLSRGLGQACSLFIRGELTTEQLTGKIVAAHRSLHSSPAANQQHHTTMQKSLRSHHLLVAALCLGSFVLPASGEEEVGTSAVPYHVGKAKPKVRTPLPTQPEYFRFNMPVGPLPGVRIWKRNGEEWTEMLPSKAVNHFKVRKPFTLKGAGGTLLAKVEEPDFFVFIPNMSNLPTGKMQLWCVKGAKRTWAYLGNMEQIGPVRY